MRKTLTDIRQKMRNGLYKNQEQVRLSLVGRIINKLGWDLWNPDEVKLGFSINTSNGKYRIGLTLFSSSDLPVVFIEIRSTGNLTINIKNIEQKLRDCNGKLTVQFSIITDGRIWRFYYPKAEGEFSEKCFMILDLLNEHVNELEISFYNFLSRSEIINGNAEFDARNYLFLNRTQSPIEAVLPVAHRLVLESIYPNLHQAIKHLLSESGLSITYEEINIFINDTNVLIFQRE